MTIDKAREARVHAALKTIIGADTIAPKVRGTAGRPDETLGLSMELPSAQDGRKTRDEVEEFLKSSCEAYPDLLGFIVHTQYAFEGNNPDMLEVFLWHAHRFAETQGNLRDYKYLETLEAIANETQARTERLKKAIPLLKEKFGVEATLGVNGRYLVILPPLSGKEGILTNEEYNKIDHLGLTGREGWDEKTPLTQEELETRKTNDIYRHAVMFHTSGKRDTLKYGLEEKFGAKVGRASYGDYPKITYPFDSLLLFDVDAEKLAAYEPQTEHPFRDYWNETLTPGYLLDIEEYLENCERHRRLRGARKLILEKFGMEEERISPFKDSNVMDNYEQGIRIYPQAEDADKAEKELKTLQRKLTPNAKTEISKDEEGKACLIVTDADVQKLAAQFAKGEGRAK